MQGSGCKIYDELPLFLNAKTVAKVLGFCRPAVTNSYMHRTSQCCMSVKA